ncbi:MAG TPA: hypothetical protein VKX17_11275 [Planctomycetota bacterium]|nr:hypothetical protein [Planctomycetota bacterium]
MNSPPRRARFQIHLSTAIVLMFVAGGLMWINSHRRLLDSRGLILDLGWPKAEDREGSESEFQRSESGVYWFGRRQFGYGWPTDMLNTSIPASLNRGDVSLEFWTDRLKDRAPEYFGGPKEEWRVEGIIINALAALPLLVLTWFLCERLIRRAARKGA